MLTPEVLRVRAAPGVDVVDWRVPARQGGARHLVGRNALGDSTITEFRAADGYLAIESLRRKLREHDLLPADADTAAWCGVPLDTDD